MLKPTWKKLAYMTLRCLEIPYDTNTEPMRKNRRPHRWQGSETSSPGCRIDCEFTWNCPFNQWFLGGSMIPWHNFPYLCVKKEMPRCPRCPAWDMQLPPCERPQPRQVAFGFSLGFPNDASDPKKNTQKTARPPMPWKTLSTVPSLCKAAKLPLSTLEDVKKDNICWYLHQIWD
jgi:hypothetical protein